MKIAILSDSHDNWDNLTKAVQIANQQQCQVLLFAGDLVSPTGISDLAKFHGQVKVVFGNNEGEKVKITRLIDQTQNITLFNNSYEETLDNIKIFMNHFPRFTQLAVQSQEFDLCIYGHTHQYHCETINNIILLNPGTTSNIRSTEATFAIFNSKTKMVNKVTIN